MDDKYNGWRNPDEEIDVEEKKRKINNQNCKITFELDESSCHGIQSMLGIVHFFAYEIFKI